MQAGGKGLAVAAPPLVAPVLTASSKTLSNEDSLSHFLFRSGKAKRGPAVPLKSREPLLFREGKGTKIELCLGGKHHRAWGSPWRAWARYGLRVLFLQTIEFSFHLIPCCGMHIWSMAYDPRTNFLHELKKFKSFFLNSYFSLPE